MGEGGGQVLRTSLTLSILTGRPFEMKNIRAGRERPGLRAQHLTCVQAAARICSAEMDGAVKGSTVLLFRPGDLTPGQYRFGISTAGATSLVLQTILLPLARAGADSRVVISGGTHVPWSPSFHYLDLQWRPHLEALGFRFTLHLVRAGFYPKGGGEIVAKIHPVKEIAPMEAMARGELRRLRGISMVGNLPLHIAERQATRTEKRLRDPFLETEILPVPTPGHGTMMLILGEFDGGRCCTFGLGELRKKAERVADDACDQFLDFLKTDATMDAHLADQLLLPLALAVGPSRFRTPSVTRHLQTNAAVIEIFGAAKITLDGDESGPGTVMVQPTGTPT